MQLTTDDYYRRFGDVTAAGLCLIDDANLVTFANRRLADLVGYSEDELRGVPLPALVDDEFRNLAEMHLRRGRTHTQQPRQVKLRTRAGGVLWVLLSASPALDHQRAAGRVLVAVSDVTERKLAVDALATAEQRLSSVLANAGESITITDLDANILMVSEGAKRVYGVSDVVELRGCNAFDLVADESIPAALEGMQTVMRHGVARNRRYRLRRRDGTTFPVQMTVSLIRERDGTPSGFVAITRDAAEAGGEAARQELADVCAVVAETLRGALSDPDADVTAARQRIGQLAADIARLGDAAATPLHRGPVDLGALVRESIAALRAAQPGREVRVNIAAELQVDGDAGFLRPVIETLLQRAWAVTAGWQQARIEVGHGAHDGDDARMYYVRAEGAGDAGTVSAGVADAGDSRLSLALIRHIVVRHGGRLCSDVTADGAMIVRFTLG